VEILSGVPLSPREESSFRNIATIKESEHLYDDISDPEDFDALFELEAQTAEIDRDKPKHHRPFQYGASLESIACFENFQSFEGRFNIKSFGVWYGALEEKTSIIEVAYHQKKFVEPDLKSLQTSITIDRKMLLAELKSDDTYDLTQRQMHEDFPRLIEDNYIFCQKLGTYLYQNSIGYILTPSARNTGGICTPVFFPEIIQSDLHLFYFHLKFEKDGKVLYTKDEDCYLDI